MEVHHHPHHEGKKTWRSYIWEFLMLFFAVFCGFLAEWRLEQMIENHREEAYMHSIVEDIHADVEQTTKLVADLTIRVSLSDSMLSVLSSDDIQQNSNRAYDLWLKTLGFPDFVQNDRTIQQLKSSGALRLIRKTAVSNKIMEYDQAVRLLAVTQTNMNSITSNTLLYSQLFDFIALNKQKDQPVPLTEGGKKLLNQAYSNRFFWRINLVGLRQRLISLHNKGEEVEAFIKEQYHL